jgi:hypothetical protein
MKSTISMGTRRILGRGLVLALLALAVHSSGTVTLAQTEAAGNPGNPGILPPGSHPFGKSYSEWVGAFWKWGLEYPVEGHPFLEHETFDLSLRQSGHVWFWAAPDFGERSCTLPAGTALFLTLRDVECSSLEAPDSGFYGETEEEQTECANFWADHIVDVFCVINDVPVENLDAYRFSSPQFEFTAPTPWIFGETGGEGTGVGDGYFLMLAPLPRGNHTIHYGGTFRFTLEEDGFEAEFPKDIIIHLTVE